MSEEKYILKVEDLNAVYMVREGTIKAAIDINFEIPEGSVMAIVGESASGKSTILEAITRTLPPNGRILSGKAIYKEGIDLLKLDKDKLRELRWKEIAIVAQAVQNALNPTISVFEHFVDTVEDHNVKWSKEEIQERANKLLELVGLNAQRVLKSYPHELSGGMRQRVLIALSLLFEPNLLILDEPTSALDVLTQARIINVLKDVHRKTGISVIFVTHDLPVAAELANYMGVVYGGNMIEKGDMNTIVKSPYHPYTQALIDSLLSTVGEIEKIKPIPGEPPSLLNPPSGCVFHPRCPYATERCKREKPPRVEVKPGHFVKCWLYM
ncbi:ABC transporter ATP-binding protein [Thermococcus sp. MV5]|uniref:ABC transporter ATP-binding protein n=1 Tax=Thermococcus sp. MV5 TaxID=1638272 RepID=UPI0014387846|nr:ABC transporter ATP-binding protein [Thermococcus sp. MV5]NJE26141.1 ABC transporter ATP-binding protein [Thermococcus sp. MV5]